MLDLKQIPAPSLGGGKRRPPFSGMLDLGGAAGAGTAGGPPGGASGDGFNRDSSLTSDVLLVFPSSGRSDQDLGGGRLLSSYPPAAKRQALGGGDSFQSRLARSSSSKEAAALSNGGCSPRMMALAEAGEGERRVRGWKGEAAW